MSYTNKPGQVIGTDDTIISADESTHPKQTTDNRQQTTANDPAQLWDSDNVNRSKHSTYRRIYNPRRATTIIP